MNTNPSDARSSSGVSPRHADTVAAIRRVMSILYGGLAALFPVVGATTPEGPDMRGA